ncbi:hypothetical protein Mgra_00003663 [Meloidogyne graminicola]|uniref:ATP synthase subunit s-like protein n=1 Tax=Meloidogyne graminicola TaxID=189291 RepID=A0A8S9ZUK2_9BILA|nr:hypothetical protein Mgra_00003663 [Meloidogyne graminicola]
MGIVEKIQEIEREISRTQKNKATEYHLGVLKAKLAKYRQELLEPSKGGSSKGEGFDVMKSGDARVALIGFPSVGKSTFLSTVTTTESVAASYEFTTLTCIPGVIEYNGANIQLLDLPGIIEGAAQGKGRGRQVIAVAKTADLILMMLDATKGDVQKGLLEKELEAVGIRLNKKPPNIYFKRKAGGGVKFTHTVPLTYCDEKMINSVLHEYKIFNADIIFRENSTVDELIDVIQGNRVYIPCLYVYNKIDQLCIEEMDILARNSPHNVVVSCEMNLNLDYMLMKIWEYLALIRIYTKKPGSPPDLGPEDGIILRGSSTVFYLTPERSQDVMPKKAIQDQDNWMLGMYPIQWHVGLKQMRYVDHSFDNLRRCGDYRHFQYLQFDQRFLPERLMFLGADLAAAHFIVHRNGSVKFLGDPHWHKREGIFRKYSLPGTKVEGMYLEAIDASGTELMFEGFDNLYDLEFLRLLSLRNCYYVDDWVLSRIGSIFSKSLEMLDLSNCKRISAKGLVGLRSLTKLRHLRLDGLENIEGIEKSALMLEDAIPDLLITGLDYDKAMLEFEDEERVLRNDRIVMDAKGNAFVEDDNGRFFYVKGSVNERVVVCDNDKPLVTSLIRREVPAIDTEEFEDLDDLTKGKLRHFLVGSPSGYSWTEQVETILTHEESLKRWEGIPTEIKMLPKYQREALLEARRQRKLLNNGELMLKLTKSSSKEISCEDEEVKNKFFVVSLYKNIFF